ncbi:MAG: 2-oxoglutarate and iron-dependent oxygenase domain-containing protein, partial [Acidimicrobiales bacterium]|nr:2-oxoglutarate and iron-dependent oxygenase domain-containing protein [Acidimicrobiales bacterium]
MPGILEEAMIPTIDLTGLGTPGCADHGRIAAQLVDIYSTVGFAYLSNHGVDKAVVEAAFEASRKFHALPLASKMA